MKRVLAIVALLVVAVAASVLFLNYRDESPYTSGDARRDDDAERIKRGGYLARAGGCFGCHTLRGGAPYAGGRGIPTPFGVVYASNLTPDAATGIGRWTRDDFWRALHNGRSKDGRFLYPAFPYTNYTEVTRDDADALFAYFASLAPVMQQNRAHELNFPYDNQVALAVWRALYFRPGVFRPEPARGDEWNRGAYLVRGLGHCSACHSARNVLGATSGDTALGGGLIPMQGWYAPALTSNAEAGVGDWELGHIVELLKSGKSPRGSTLGPMAEVVYWSTQYLSDGDARAIATFLKSLPGDRRATVAEEPEPIDAKRLAQGRRIYEERCVDCHGANGEGVAGMYPALAGNRSVTLASPSNAVRVVLNGGYPPGTPGNPRPYGMPPFAPFLADDDIAAVVTYIRNAWGNRAPPVLGFEVARQTRGAKRE